MNDFIRYLAESGLCLVLFYAGYWFLMRKETTFVLNRVYLLGSILMSMIIPLLKVPSPFRTVALPAAPLEGLPALSPAGRHFDAVWLIMAVYAAGALIFLARFVRQLARLYLLVKGSEGRELNGLRLVSVDKDFAPFSFLRYVFLNSQSFSPLSLSHILVHERAHVRQGHSLDILAVECLTVLHWFNPIVRPYKKSIKETHEFLADGEVIAQGFNAAEYRRLMLEQQVGFRLPEFSNNFKQTQITRRIVMMSQVRSKGAARLKVLLLLPLGVLLVLALAQPRLIVTADQARIFDAQETSDTGQAELKRKETIAQASENLAILKEKEAKLQQALESESDPVKQQDLKASLKVFMELRKATEAYLKDPKNVPPPPPLPPPAPRGEAGLKMLQEKEEDIRKQLASEKDPAKIQKLKEILEKVLSKQKDIQADLRDEETPPVPPSVPEARAEALTPALAVPASAPLPPAAAAAAAPAATPAAAAAPVGSAPAMAPLPPDRPPAPSAASAPAIPPPPPPPPDAKNMLLNLKEKEAAVRKELSETQDPAKQAQLEGLLKKIVLKRDTVQAEMEKAQSPKVLTADDLKKIAAELDQKEADVRAELGKSQDPQKTAELNDLLHKIQAKREAVKAKMEELQKAKIEKN